MSNNINNKGNRNRFVIHGLFYHGAVTAADPSTILPLIASFFSSSNVVIGILSSLLRGGAIIMQLFAAFYAQSYSRVINYIRILFIFRFLSWSSIGVSIYFFGTSSPNLTLFLIGLGLFLFSFSAGFGSVYFNELLGKCFTNEYRGKTMAYRQFVSGLSAILSGFLSAWFLENFEKPYSFAYLFMTSSVIMSMGYIALGTVKEEEKKNVSVKENSFIEFLKNSGRILKSDSNLKMQIITMLLSYSYLFSFPFIIVQIKETISLFNAGIFVSIHMAGAMISNILWGKLSGNGKNKQIILTSFVMMILSLATSIITMNVIVLYFVFFFAGAASDGFKLAFNNLILVISPEDKRPIYIALQNNLTSIGLFFSIPGGYLLSLLGFNFILIFSIVFLLTGFLFSFKLRD